MYKIKSNNIGLNRKMLAHLAVVDPKVWSLLVDSTNK